MPLEEYRIPSLWLYPWQREWLLSTYHLNRENDRKLFVWLLMGQRDDVVDRLAVVVSQRLIEKIYGANTPVEKTIRRLEQTTGIQMAISDYRFTAGLATTVRMVPPDDLAKLLGVALVQSNRHKPDKLHFVTGERWSARRAKSEHRRRAAEVDAYMQTVDGINVPLLEHLNSPRVWRAQRQMLLKNLPAVHAKIRELASKDERVDACEQYMAILSDLMTYKTVDGNDRVYPAGSSIVQMPRDVRKAAFTDCYELDLVSCHLSIVGSRLKVPGVLEAVKEDVWESLARHTGYSVEHYKGWMKKAVYTFQNGGGADTIVEEILKLCRTSDCQRIYPEKGKRRCQCKWCVDKRAEIRIFVEAFEQVPWVQDFREATGSMIRKIMADGCVLDARGVRHGLPEGKKNVYRAACALMSRWATSFEVEIMTAAFRAIQEDPDLLLVLWLYDGCYVQAVNHRSSADYKMDRVKRVAETKADDLDIDMNVKWEPLVAREPGYAKAA